MFERGSYSLAAGMEIVSLVGIPSTFFNSALGYFVLESPSERPY